MRGVEFFKPLLSRSLLTGSALTGACVFMGGAFLGCSSGEAEPVGPGTGPTTSTTTGTAAGPTSGTTGTTSTTGGATATNTAGTTSGTTGTTSTVGTTGGVVTTTTGGSVTSTGVGGGSSMGATVGTTGSSGNCGITVDSYDLSTAIATVGVVSWSATSTIDSANIEFGPSDGGFTMSAPVDLAEPGYRTLLLGMKGQKEYSFRVVAMSGGQTCTSETYSLTTGPVDNSVPNISHQTQNAGMATKTGFIVLSAGLGGFGGPGGPGGGGSGAPAFIIDMDGDPVWWAPAPASCSRARMDWEGKNMWMMELNVDRGGGEMRKVAMDGTGAENNIQGLNNSHHDFTVLPGGIIATVSWGSGGGGEPPSDLIERAPDGTITKVATLDQNFYNPGGQGFHANSILWHEADQSYTVSDRYPNLYIKLTRTGQLVWQFGGQNPVDQSKFISGGSWSVNHGHHLLDNGNLIVFSNGNGGQSPVIEFALDTQSMTATEVWRYTGGTSNVLGDVQRLDNGNTFVTYSVSGVIQEVNGQSVLQSYTTDSLGYAMYRPTLYGPPPK